MAIVGQQRIDGVDSLGGAREHYTGSGSEHLAAAWYLRRGYQVYWPAMQHSCVDFLIEKNRTIRKVQVKTATWIKSGRFSYLQCRTRLTNGGKHITPREMYDLLVILSGDLLWEIPAPMVTSTNISLCTTSKKGLSQAWRKYLHSTSLRDARSSAFKPNHRKQTQ